MIWAPKKPHLILPGDEDYQPPSNCHLLPHRMMMAAAGADCATTVSAAGEWNGKTASFTFTGDDIDPTALGAIKTGVSFTGNFTLEWSPKIPAVGHNYFGCYATVEDGTFDQEVEQGGVNTMTNSWWINYDRCMYGGTTKFTFTGSSTVVYKLTRSGGDTFKFYKDGSLEHTFADTSSTLVRFWMGAGGDNLAMENISWKPCS